MADWGGYQHDGVQCVHCRPKKTVSERTKAFEQHDEQSHEEEVPKFLLLIGITIFLLVTVFPNEDVNFGDDFWEHSQISGVFQPFSSGT